MNKSPCILCKNNYFVRSMSFLKQTSNSSSIRAKEYPLCVDCISRIEAAPEPFNNHCGHDPFKQSAYFPFYLCNSCGDILCINCPSICADCQTHQNLSLWSLHNVGWPNTKSSTLCMSCRVNAHLINYLDVIVCISCGDFYCNDCKSLMDPHFQTKIRKMYFLWYNLLR